MEVKGQPAPGASAPYGHACASCAKAKCKCISRGSGSCERCNRRGLECRSSDAVRKRNSKRPGVASRTSLLEERLEDLVTLLRSQQKAEKTPLASSDAQVALGLMSGASNDSEQARGLLAAAGGVHVPGHGDQGANGSYPTPLTTISGTPSHTSPRSTISNYGEEVSPTEAEQILFTFRTQHQSYFPFILIPPEVTAQQFQLDRPFLWLNIRVLCSKSTSQIQMLSETTREIIGRKAFVNIDRDMDLFLSCLVHIAWSTYHTRGKSFLNRYCNLANSLMSEFRLDKPTDVCTPYTCHKPSSSHGQPYEECSANQPKCTNELRRAVLATFILSSTVSNFTRTDLVRWSPYMESYLETLAANPEYPGDEVLVAMAKISLIVEDVASVSWKQSDYAMTTAPVVFVKLLRTRLDQLRKSFSPELLQNRAVLTYLCNAEIFMNEVAVFHPLSPVVTPNLQNVSPNVFPIPTIILPETSATAISNRSLLKPLDIPRLEMLHRCLDASKRWVDNYFTFTPEQYPVMPFAFYTHFLHVAQVIFRLSILDEPDWDRSAVRQTVDVVAMLSETADRMSQVADAVGVIDENANLYVFARAAATLKNTVAVWEAALARHGGGKGDVSMATAVSVDTTGSEAVYNSGDALPTMEFGNEAWLNDLFTSWEA